MLRGSIVSMKPKKRKTFSHRKYTGKLANPIYEPIFGGLLSELARPQAEKRANEQRLVKLQSLFVWYEIDPDAPNAWEKLAIFLALTHVPGMQVIHEPKGKRGRKPSWKDGLANELLNEVKALRPGHNSYEAAIRELRADKSKIWKRYTLPNLITRHREARRAEAKRRLLAKALANTGTTPVMGAGLLGAIGSLRADENS